MPALRDRKIQQDFREGMSRDIAPALIGPAGVYDLADSLLDEDGNAYRRGGTAYKSSKAFGSKGLVWAFDGYLLPGGRTVFANESDFGVLASDDKEPINLGGAGLTAPKQSAVLEDLLFVGGTAIYGGSRKEAVYSTGKVKVTNGSKTVEGEGTTWNTLVDAGMILHLGSDRVYVVASIDSTTKITLRDAYEGESAEKQSYTLNPVWTIGGSDPYEAWSAMTVCANRLVLGNGNTIKFTEVLDPHTFVNSLGTVNQHTLPEGTQIVGLATVGQTVLIFTTGGIWVLDGLARDLVDQNGNTQHSLQQLSSELVLAGAAGLAGSGQQLVVPAADGIYLLDSVSQPVRISRPIDRLYRDRITSGYRLGGAKVFRDHYFLPLLDSTGVARETLACQIGRPLRSRSQTVYPWVRLTGDGGELRAFAVRHTADPSNPRLLGAQSREPSRLVDCSSYFEPEEAFATDADGSVHNFDLITRDIETGGLTENVVRSLKLLYELVGDGTLKVYWSDGSLEGGGAEWDEVSWDEFEWAADEGAVFNAVATEGPPSDGRKPQKFRINKRLRYGRFRITTSGPLSFFALRMLEMDVRPSQAVRR